MPTSTITAQDLLRSLAQDGKIEKNPERFLNLRSDDPIPPIFLSDKVAIYSELANILKSLAGRDPSLNRIHQEIESQINEIKAQIG